MFKNEVREPRIQRIAAESALNAAPSKRFNAKEFLKDIDIYGLFTHANWTGRNSIIALHQLKQFEPESVARYMGSGSYKGIAHLVQQDYTDRKSGFDLDDIAPLLWRLKAIDSELYDTVRQSPHNPLNWLRTTGLSLLKTRIDRGRVGKGAGKIIEAAMHTEFPEGILTSETVREAIGWDNTARNHAQQDILKAIDTDTPVRAASVAVSLYAFDPHWVRDTILPLFTNDFTWEVLKRELQTWKRNGQFLEYFELLADMDALSKLLDDTIAAPAQQPKPISRAI